MKYKALIFIPIIILIHSCNQSSNNENKAETKNKKSIEVYKPEKKEDILIEDLIKTKGYFKLSEIAQNIEYIKLELTEVSQVDRKSTVLLSSDFIFVCGYKEGVLQFGSDGRFIRKIGKKGKGPKEYIYPRHLSINEQIGHLYIHAPTKMLIYSFNGEFIKSIKIPEYSKMVGIYDELFIAWNNISWGIEEYIFLLLNSNLDTLDGVKNYFKWQKRETSSRIGFSDYKEFCFKGNNFFFKDMYTDTVYQVEGGNNIVPAYFVDLGKYKLPETNRPSFINNRKKQGALLQGYLWVNILESDEYVYLNSHSYFGRNSEKYLLLFNKKNSSGLMVSESLDKYAGIVNDIDGGLNFWPKNIYYDKYLYLTIPAYEFIETTTEALVKGTDILYPDKKEKLKQFLTDLSDEDNPIIMKVHLH